MVNEIIIALIVMQAIVMGLGYYALAREINDARKRLRVLGGLVFALPILVYGIKIGASFPHMQIGELTDFLIFYFTSVIVNGVTGTIVNHFEKAIL